MKILSKEETHDFKYDILRYIIENKEPNKTIKFVFRDDYSELDRNSFPLTIADGMV